MTIPPAPSGVIVPSLTANGYPVCWKCNRAWLFPPEPSKYLRPQKIFPSVRFIHRFSCRSQTSHLQPLKERRMYVKVKNHLLLCSPELSCTYQMCLQHSHMYAPRRDFDPIVELFKFSCVFWLLSHFSVPLLHLQSVRHWVCCLQPRHRQRHLQTWTTQHSQSKSALL